MSMPLRCRICDESFEDDCDLYLHGYLDAHSMLIWNCSQLCGRAFRTEEELMHHILTAPLHHILDEFIEVDPWSMTPGLRCEDCGVPFFSVESLYHHLKYLPEHDIPEEQLRPYGSGPQPSMEWVCAEVARHREEKRRRREQRRPERRQQQLHAQQPARVHQLPSVSFAAATGPASVIGHTFSALAASAQSTVAATRPDDNASAEISPNTSSDQDEASASLPSAERQAGSVDGLPTFGPPTLQEELIAMVSKLHVAEAALERQIARHRCPVCYENEVNAVTECGHQFCLDCLSQWQSGPHSTWNTRCPTCRDAMGNVVKTYTNGSSS